MDTPDKGQTQLELLLIILLAIISVVAVLLWSGSPQEESKEYVKWWACYNLEQQPELKPNAIASGCADPDGLDILAGMGISDVVPVDSGFIEVSPLYVGMYLGGPPCFGILSIYDCSTISLNLAGLTCIQVDGEAEIFRSSAFYIFPDLETCDESTYACDSDDDCPPDQICLDGDCVPRPLCTTDDDCTPPEICIAGVCMPPGGFVCSSDDDCPEGWTCIDGICMPPGGFVCELDDECPPGWRCVEGICMPPGGFVCESDDECPPGWFCLEGICVPQGGLICTSSDECPPDWTCENGICIPPGGWPCILDIDCPEGWFCNNGFCEVPEVPLEERIGAWTKTKPGEAIFLVGDGLDEGVLMAGDIDSSMEAEVIMRDEQKIIAIIPEELGDDGIGTFWLWLQGSDFLSTRIPVNYPEPWWIQPNRVDSGDSTRMFGRNMDAYGSYALEFERICKEDPDCGGGWGSCIIEEGRETGVCENTAEGGATSIEPNAARFTVPGSLEYGDYNVYIKEPKTEGEEMEDLYGPVELFVEEPFVLPSNSVDVTNYGAVPDDDDSDTEAFIDAIRALPNGGTVNIPAGRYKIDGSDMMQLSAGIVLGLDKVRLKGAGMGSTELFLTCSGGAGCARAIIRYINMRSHSQVEDMTLTVDPDGVYTNVAYLTMLETHTEAGGYIPTATVGSKVSDVRFDSDDFFATQSLDGGITIEPIWWNCMDCVFEDSELYGRTLLFISGKQITVRRVEQYGIPGPDYRWGIMGPNLLGSWGVDGLIVEDCFVSSRSPYDGGHSTRFFASGPNRGGLHHMYFARNGAEDVMHYPYGGTGENLLFEGGCRYVYKGEVSVDPDDPRILYLADELNIGPDKTDAYYQGEDIEGIFYRQDTAPLSAIVMGGKGLGQIRDAYLLDEGTVRLENPFVVNPDDTSSLLIDFHYDENIIYDNDFRSGSVLYSAGVGTVPFGKTLNTIVKDNYFEGFNNGYADSLLGCSGRATQATYFNEVVDNIVVGSKRGILTHVLHRGDREDIISLGNVYRHNTIQDLVMNLAQVHFEAPPVALGIVAPLNYDGETGDSAIGHIYEDNLVDTASIAFEAQDFIDWLVLRNNQFLNIYDKGIDIDPGIDEVFEDGNTVDLLPQVEITVPAELENLFHCPVPLQCFLWVPEELKDSVDPVTTNANPSSIDLGSLSDGAHVMAIHSGAVSKTLYIFVGDTETFDDWRVLEYGGVPNDCPEPPPASVQECRDNPPDFETCPGLGQGLSFCYDTLNKDEVLANHGFSFIPGGTVYDPARHYEKAVSTRYRSGPVGYPTNYLMLYANYENAVLRDEDMAASADSSEKAVLALFKDHHACSYNVSRISLRLHQDAENYYEFSDNCGNADTVRGWVVGSFGVKRTLQKVVNGNPDIVVSELNAHRGASPVFLMADGDEVKFAGWGESMELDDSNPLDIRYWEIEVASTPNGDWQEKYDWFHIDNLFFEKGDGIDTF